MNTFKSLMLGLLLSLSASAAYAQIAPSKAASESKSAASDEAQSVTVSVSAKGVRFIAPGGVGRMRLEVFGAASESLYDSGFLPGNLRDWSLKDKQDAPLADGSYLCVVTIRNLAGKLSVRQGTILVQAGQAALQFGESAEAGAVEPDKSLVAVTAESAPATTMTAHNGREGQVISTRGALTFRAGDFFSGRDAELMRLTPEGNLGIGTAAPQAKLDVAGQIRARGGIQFDDGTVLNSASVIAERRNAATGGASAAAAVDPLGTTATGTGTAGRISKWTDNAGTLGDSTITETGTGFVGVGTSSPDAKMVVEGVIPAPQGKLMVVRTTGSNNGYGFAIDATGSGNNNFGFTLNGVPKAGMAFDVPRQFFGLNNFAYSAQDFALRLNSDGSLSYNDGSVYPGPERFRITATGSVGIGTATPQSKLDVVGDINVSGNAVVAGNIAAKYQDVAEWVPAREKLAAGTVVVLDRARTNGVAASRRAYDTHVGGVVSAQPGVILGVGGEGKVLVATTGRVRVKVDATRRPIRVGDLLVTSGREGMAMKSVPVSVGGARLHRPGTIVGKALEPLANGTGEILVLLSLQ